MPHIQGSIPGSVRSPGGGHGNPRQYSCLENPMERGAWWATVHGVAELGVTYQLSNNNLGVVRVKKTQSWTELSD